MQIPRATYRLQFNGQFRLADALALVPYLDELGISHIYASPLLKASPHSAHGYDVCDFGRLNPEIGTEADLKKLAHALHRRKMGLVLDIVPNHMGVSSPENRWWWDVLTHGENSRFAKHFDIDWRSSDPNLCGKVLVPVLGDEYETLLSRGEFRLLREKGRFVLGYHEHRFPLAPQTVARVPKDPAGLTKFNSDISALDQLVRRQHYLLAFHIHGDARLNYRRFFAVSSLAAVRVEDPPVFDAVHARVRKWIENGWLDSVRVDHPDGLRDPEKYLQRLRSIAPDLWIVVEKILEPGEMLPETWPVQGTTGYDFLNQVNGLFVDAAAEAPFTDFYAEFTGETVDYPALVREKKHAVLKTLLAAELNRLAGLLASAAAAVGAPGNFSIAELRDALAETIVCFPVYRSYFSGKKTPPAADLEVVKAAVHLACGLRPDLPAEIFACIHELLLKPSRAVVVRNFVARFQQLTGPVMAKSVEDTAFYCFNRFVSLNEVGGDPKTFGVEEPAVHRFLTQQHARWPASQLATSTHDTKRGEDVRARLNLLSEIPETWKETVRRWSTLNARHRQNDLPDRNAEYFFYQTLVGSWPISEERAQAYMEKAALEAKRYTTWTARNAPYEKALRHFISGILHDPQFTADLEHFVGTLRNAAAINSLAQTLIKLTAPGVPDIYQGCELWDLSLVDPDNRRPVDFELRRNLLAAARAMTALTAWEQRDTGVCKLWLIRKTLALRRHFSDLAVDDFQPLWAFGAKRHHVFAFSRAGKIIVLVPRFVLKLNHEWAGTTVVLPEGLWGNEFTGENLRGEILMEEVFRAFPVALLRRKEEP